ncbi:MAG: hypothetical protein WCI20_14175, partial [bacterium]
SGSFQFEVPLLRPFFHFLHDPQYFTHRTWRMPQPRLTVVANRILPALPIKTACFCDAPFLAPIQPLLPFHNRATTWNNLKIRFVHFYKGKTTPFPSMSQDQTLQIS